MMKKKDPSKLEVETTLKDTIEKIIEVTSCNILLILL